VAGVTLGDTSGMTLADREAFRASGLYHLVAVSGQNVALVVVFALACLALLGVIGAPARVVAIALTLVYVLVTGAGPSIVRAGVAGGLVSVAWLASRPVVRWHLVACGAVVVLAINPLDLFNPGFQLSFLLSAPSSWSRRGDHTWGQARRVGRLHARDDADRLVALAAWRRSRCRPICSRYLPWRRCWSAG
jgi:predicted membrane metal-binding protein